MLTITSPGLKPALMAAPSGTSSSTRGAVTWMPTNVNVTAKMTMARMKLAIGPAATIAARAASDLFVEGAGLLVGGHALQGGL